TSEEDKPNLLTFYSTSKISAEAYAECFLNNYGLKISIVRYSNCFGPNQHQDNPYSGVIGKFIGRALRNEPLVIHDDGLQTRDFTYIDDACEATIEAAINPNAIGKIYNIGTGVETTINELAETVIAETKTASLIEREPPRPVDTIKRRVLDISLVQKDLGWQPTTSLAEGIRLAIEWEKTQLAPEGENSQRAVI
ncbi:MAG: epimerase, partial [Alphaproteobacteria bacterium CG11_big_fil_rev_8_21_14_0_20_44_7]